VDHPNWLFNGFKDALSDCNLHDDLSMEGWRDTNSLWQRDEASDVVEEKLD